jgi:hypothetical protein
VVAISVCVVASQSAQQGVAAAVFDEADLVVVEPGLEAGRAVDVGGEVDGLALAIGVDDPDVAAG